MPKRILEEDLARVYGNRFESLSVSGRQAAASFSRVNLSRLFL